MSTERLILWMVFVVVLACLAMCTFGGSAAAAAGGSVLAGIGFIAWIYLMIRSI